MENTENICRLVISSRSCRIHSASIFIRTLFLLYDRRFGKFEIENKMSISVRYWIHLKNDDDGGCWQYLRHCDINQTSTIESLFFSTQKLFLRLQHNIVAMVESSIFPNPKSWYILCSLLNFPFSLHITTHSANGFLSKLKFINSEFFSSS